MSYAAAEADRRISQTVQLGEIVEVNSNGTARVQIGALTTLPIPVSQFRAGAMRTWWMPALGEQVVLFVPSGNVSRAVIGPSIFASNAPSSDAQVPMFDLGGGRMEIVGDLKIDGDLHVTGDVTVDGDVIVGGVSFRGHVHSGIAQGGSNTDNPVGF